MFELPQMRGNSDEIESIILTKSFKKKFEIVYDNYILEVEDD